MYCKFCGAELCEDTAVCPSCGEVQAESVAAPKKKISTGKLIAIIAGGVALLAVLVGAILYGVGVDLRPRENDIFRKDSYTVKDDVAEKNAGEIVATMGDQVLTNGELQAYYWTSVYDFMDYYGYYLSMMGVDIAKPLDQQVYDQETGKTFQQMFLENGLEIWRRYATLYQMSQEAGFELNAEQKAYMDSLEERLNQLAKENKYDDVEEFIDKEMFPGCSLEAYLNYNRLSYIGLSYYDTLYESLMPGQEEIEAYYTKNEDSFEENGFSKSDGDYYAVRHILIGIEGGTKDDKGNITYSDAEWEACKAKAQKLLDDFLAGDATEEAFAELAKKHSEDPGSKDNGGLYEDLTKKTSFIEGFKNWYLEEGRKPGDTGLVKNTESSVQGYHIMYFSGSEPIWEKEATAAVLSENTSKMLEEAEEKWPMTVNYKKIVLGYVDLAAE